MSSSFFGVWMKRGRIFRKRIERRITCPECRGWGGHDIAQVCPVCDDQLKILCVYFRTFKRRQ